MEQMEIDQILAYHARREFPASMRDSEKSEYEDYCERFLPYWTRESTPNHQAKRWLKYQAYEGGIFHKVITTQEATEFIQLHHGLTEVGEHKLSASQIGQALRQRDYLVPNMNEWIRDYLTLNCMSCYTEHNRHLLRDHPSIPNAKRLNLCAKFSLAADPDPAEVHYGLGTFSRGLIFHESMDTGNTFYRMVLAAIGESLIL